MPLQLRGLLDDAPASGSVDEVVRAHQAHRRARYVDLVGSLVVTDSTLPLPVSAGSPEVVLVVSGGAGAVEPAVTWATRDDTLTLRGVQVAVRESDAGDLAPNARRIVTAADSLVASGALDEEVPLYVEPPAWHGGAPSASWLSALDEVAAVDQRLALRLEGTEGAPSSAQVAAWIAAALDRELCFRCTAGPQHAVRRRDPVTGADRHGFLNVLVATRASLDGAATDDVAALLEQTDGEELLAATDETALASARRWFVSCDSGDIPGAVRELTELRLLAGV